MRFDFTKGKEPRYLVQVYAEWGNDQFYYYYFKEAMEKFRKLKEKEWGIGTIITVYDMVKDIRKEYVRVGE